MKQKILILMVAMMSTVSIFASNFNVGGIYYQTPPSNQDQVMVVAPSGFKYTGNVNIPGSVEYNGISYKVTIIGANAFYNCTNLTSVTIPNSVKTIGNSAFQNCVSLTSVSIPNSVKIINERTFEGCTGLTSVTIPNSVTSIGFRAFCDCASLTSVTIPNSVTSIANAAFLNCTNLTSVTIPESVTSIGGSILGNTALYNEESNWENGVLYVGNHLIDAKSDQVTGSFTIKNGTLTLASSAFEGFTNLTSVFIPNSVTTIGPRAFYGCTTLTSITIPNSVTSIGSSILNNTALYNEESNWENGVLYVGNHLIDANYDKVAGDYTIKNGTLTLASYAFSECHGLNTLSIPNSVVSIGDNTFSGCIGLTSIDIPNSVTSIGSNAFHYCSKLTSVIIPNSVISIGDDAFNDCRGLTSIYISNSVTTIGSRAFQGCSGLTSVSIPNSVTTIGYYAFLGCTSLTALEIPSSVTTIGYRAFASSSLTSVTVKNSNPSNISIDEEIFIGTTFSSANLYVPKGCKELYAAANQWKEFGNIEEFQPAINLADGQPYTETTEQQDVDVNYTRTFIPDIWQPLYVPFNMSYKEWKDYGQVAELSCVHAYEDGRTTIEFVTVNSGELLPNVPYVFLPNTGDEITFTCTGKTLKAVPAENTKYIMCSSPRYTFKIYGNYQPVSGSTLATYGDSQFNGAYVMTTDNKFQHCSPSATLKPYRFYITREKSANGYWGAPARQNAPAADNDDDDVIYFMVDGKVCGIADIVTDTDGDGAIYDLMGREVKNPSNGIYIQNGKKIRIY